MKLSICIAILFFGLNAPAALESDMGPSQSGIYKVPTEFVSLRPAAVILHDRLEQPSDASIPIAAGEEIAVQFDENDAIITLSGELEGDAPSKYIISRSDFAQLNLMFDRPGDATELNSDSYETASSGKLVTNGHRGSKGRGRNHASGHRMVLVANGRVMASGCVAYVYSIIGLQGTRPGNGKDVTGNLKSTGRFHYLDKNVCRNNPPENAIASWTGGDGSGHTAIRRHGAWCYDLACADPGSGYSFLNCVVASN